MMTMVNLCTGARRREYSPGGATAAVHAVGTSPPVKKPRLVFTDIQRRTLLAIFCETRRPNKDMQTVIADQLGLKVSGL